MSVANQVKQHRIATISTVDPVWARIRLDAEAAVSAEPLLASYIHSTVLAHERFEQALSFLLAQKIASAEAPAVILREIVDQALVADPDIAVVARADILAVYDRDPACRGYIEPLLYFKGFHAIQAYRIAHWLWLRGRRELALFIQSRVSAEFSVDIHPAARIGRGIMIDHAHSMVIGETAVVGDEVSLLHGVTLGGTGKESGDRHPKIGRGVLIGAGAKVLGNLKVGDFSRIAAGSVVLHDVPANCTVAGIPARVVGCAGCDEPARAMDQTFSTDEPDFSI